MLTPFLQDSVAGVESDAVSALSWSRCVWSGWRLASAFRSPLYPSDQSLSPLNFKIGAATVPSSVRRSLVLVAFWWWRCAGSKQQICGWKHDETRRCRQWCYRWLALTNHRANDTYMIATIVKSYLNPKRKYHGRAPKTIVKSEITPPNKVALSIRC